MIKLYHINRTPKLYNCCPVVVELWFNRINMKDRGNCVYCKVNKIKPTGKKYCSYLCLNRSKDQYGEKNPDWKGGKVKNSGLHAFMQSTFGKGEKCEHCGIKGFYYKCKNFDRWSIEWANTGIYDRERINWLQLCRKCHVRYDTDRRKKTKQITQTFKLKDIS